MTQNSYIHSPLNYTGGKYKLLKYILPLFPRQIETFVDLFAGGLNVGINVTARKILANDQLTYLIDLYKFFQKTSWTELRNALYKRIDQFELSHENKNGYLTLRKQYNSTHDSLDLFLLTCYAFNHQIRFNSKHEFNTPFGQNRSAYNSSIESNLAAFVDRLQTRNITLSSGDFLSVNLSSLTEADFVYCDPPYLITTGSYNDGKRGFKDWTEAEENQLLALLDNLNSRRVKFALSNVIIHKGRTNDILIDWSKRYHITHIKKTYSNCSYHLKERATTTDEVLITNYQPIGSFVQCQMNLH